MVTNKRMIPVLLLFACAWVFTLFSQSTPPRDGGREALLIIDIQNFYFPGGRVPLAHPEAAAKNAGRLLARFRELGLPVFHVRHLPRDSAAGNLQLDREWNFCEDVTPRDGEMVISKHYANSFRETELPKQLQAKQIKRLVICGMQTHMCVEAAVRAAADLGFEVILVQDACATRALEYNGVKVPAEFVHTSTLASLNGTYARVIALADYLATEKTNEPE